MTKIDIISGFLGAGKTTLIKKLVAEAYKGEKLVIIENEFGQIAIDGGFLKESGINVTEMNSGCICCSLVGDFSKSLKEVEEKFAPDRIIIEPSGVGKLSDVIKAVKELDSDTLILNSAIAVADAKKCRVYMKNFGEFYNNQLESATAVILSRTGDIAPEKLQEALDLIRGKNPAANIITTPWDQLDGKTIVEAMEKSDLLKEKMEALVHEHHHHHDHDCDCGCHDHEHHHDHDEHDHEHEHDHHHDHDCDCGCHDHEHHHDHDHDEHDHEHHHEHHHDHGPDCDCGCHDHDHHHDHDHDEHEHHHEHHDHDHDHDHGPDCDCGCHDHEHHHHHHGHDADEIFVSWGCQTVKRFSADELKSILEALNDEEGYGHILRAKGIVEGKDGAWLHFDFVPGEAQVRTGTAEITGAVCVIGAELKEEKLADLFK